MAAFQGVKLVKKGAKAVDVGKGAVKVADPSAVVNALSDFSSKKMMFGSDTFLLDKSGMNHILERHHPNFWDGSVNKTQSFLNKNMSIDDVSDAIHDVMKQNRNTLINKGTTGMYQITGTVNGVDYVVGFKNGKAGQFYPK